MSGTELVRYDAMCQAIAAAYEVDEVKHIRDKALALQTYASQARNVEAERQACEIRLRAERRCGQMLRDREMAKGTRGQLVGPSSVQAPIDQQKPLAELGISHTQSSRWQKLAAIPDRDFEATFAGAAARPTTQGLITAHTPKPAAPVTPVDPRALWLWGRLLDFEREGLLAADPTELFGTMLEHMKETTLELAPQVAAWLRRLSP